MIFQDLRLRGFPLIRIKVHTAFRNIGFDITPAVDVVEKDKAFEVTAELLGLGAKIIDLQLCDGVLRGGGDIENWDEFRAEAARAHNKRTAAYLLGMPMLTDHPEEALSKFGHTSEEVEADIL